MIREVHDVLDSVESIPFSLKKALDEASREIFFLTKSNSPEESARLGELVLEFEKQKSRYEGFGVGYYVSPFERLNKD